MKAEHCIFCRIIGGQEQSYPVYENEKVLSFLSNRPVNVGHTLVIPKKHYKNIYEIPEDEAAQLFTVTKRLAAAVKRTVNADGIRIVQNNGEAAGQVVFHMHVHIIPMYAKSSFLHGEPRGANELQADAERIRRFV